MPTTRLDITDFRNISTAKIEPISEGFNVIFGNNGSGKTSFLESIYYLSLGKSFRSSNNAHIVQKTADSLYLFSNIHTNQQVTSVGIERQKDGVLAARIDGKDVTSIAEVANLLPILLINSNCYNLLDSGPAFRRKYLDWGAFYYTKSFLSVWKQYRRVLKQRNAALSSRVSRKELLAWSHEMTESAVALDALRQEYVKELFPILKEMLAELLDLSDLKMEYYSGWEKHTDFKAVLAASLEKDMVLGFTQFGPHRANIQVTVKHLPAKDILSRGQQKLFVCAMILAQGTLLNRAQNKHPIYLIDDLPSELDMTSRSNLIALLSKQDAQVFVTAVEKDIYKSCVEVKPTKLFHVEHGNLRQVDV